MFLWLTTLFVFLLSGALYANLFTILQSVQAKKVYGVKQRNERMDPMVLTWMRDRRSSDPDGHVEYLAAE